MEVVVRRARTADVRRIRALIDTYSGERRLLSKATVTLYEDVQEFWVAERLVDGAIVGCGALHVMWEDLAEIRTLAVDPACRGQKVGHRIVTELLNTARDLGIPRVFCLTFETGFFASFGFVPIDGAPVPARSTSSCSARTTRASPSSSAWSASSRTRWATPGCSST